MLENSSIRAELNVVNDTTFSNPQKMQKRALLPHTCMSVYFMTTEKLQQIRKLAYVITVSYLVPSWLGLRKLWGFQEPLQLMYLNVEIACLWVAPVRPTTQTVTTNQRTAVLIETRAMITTPAALMRTWKPPFRACLSLHSPTA